MESLISAIQIIFFGVLMFSIIVTIHEAGHFTAARLFGLRVKEFMLGLPGPNIGFRFKGTKFGITPILLGGYALIAGENSTKDDPNLARAYAYLVSKGALTDAEAEEASNEQGYNLEEALDMLEAWGTVERTQKKGVYTYSLPAVSGGGRRSKEAKDIGLHVASQALNGKAISLAEAEQHIADERKLTLNGAAWYKRVIIYAAGVIFNLVFAIVVITASMMITGTYEPSTTVASFTETSPAQAAGMAKGDSIVALDDVPIDSWPTLTQSLSAKAPGDKVQVTVSSGGASKEIDVVLGDNNGTPMLGIAPVSEHRPVSFGTALSTSTGYIGLVTEFIIKLFNPMTAAETVSQSSSVIGVSFLAKDAAEAGPLAFITVSAILSISIGLMNFLPFPPLDGGRILVEVIERVSGRRIPQRVISTITMAAVGLLILLFVVVMWQDIQRFIIGG